MLIKLESSILEVVRSFIFKKIETLKSFSNWDGFIIKNWPLIKTLPFHGAFSKKVDKHVVT